MIAANVFGETCSLLAEPALFIFKLLRFSDTEEVTTISSRFATSRLILKNK